MATLTSDNSYVTLLEAESYFDERLYSDNWDNAEEQTKIKAIIQATRRLDNEDYYGDRVSSTQSLKFPRYGIGYLDGIYLDNIIPKQLKQATYETAIFLLSNDITKKDVNTGDIKALKIGSIGIDYVQNSNISVESNNTLPDYVLSLLDGLSKTAGIGGVVNVGR